MQLRAGFRELLHRTEASFGGWWNRGWWGQGIVDLYAKLYIEELHEYKGKWIPFRIFGDYFEEDYYLRISTALLDEKKPIVKIGFFSNIAFQRNDNFSHQVEVNLEEQAGDHVAMVERLLEVAKIELSKIPQKI